MEASPFEGTTRTPLTGSRCWDVYCLSKRENLLKMLVYFCVYRSTNMMAKMIKRQVATEKKLLHSLAHCRANCKT